MKFSERLQQKRPVLSFEFFPPKREDALASTFAMIDDLAALSPDFMTVTYGAGGGTRALTRNLVEYIARHVDTTAVAHLTCVNHSASELDEILDDFESAGVKNILALRGDKPKDNPDACFREDGYCCARDLVRHISSRGGFSVAVAGYPEMHPDATSWDEDITYLREKVDAGAELIVTQLFFEVELYIEFCEKAKRAGIDVPIIPGIMPISNVAQIERFTSMCKAKIPDALHIKLHEIAENSEAVVEFGIQYSIALCQELFEAGAPGIHLYTLNKSIQARPIVESLQKELGRSS